MMIKNILIFAFLFLTLISCSKDDKIILVNSTGRINHVLIVIKNSDWQGEIGNALREIIATPVSGLPQDEAQFSITQVPPETFNNLFKPTRNILFVGMDSKRNFYSNKNIYAEPQITLSILGKNKEDLIDNINTHKNEIISIFKKNDLALYQKKITKDHHNPKKVETFNKLGFTLKIPFDYKEVEDNGDFLWYRNEITKGLLNIVAYELPNRSNEDFSPENLIKHRDSIGKLYIPGQFENTYMMTEPQFNPVVQKIKLSGLNTLESRGLWIVKGDYMGGPFISYTIEDKKNKRFIVIEGFSYSPSTKKRDFIFELEAILKTFSI